MRKIHTSRICQPAQPTARTLADASLHQARGGGSIIVFARALGPNEPESKISGRSIGFD